MLEHRFAGATALGREDILFLARVSELDEQQRPHTKILRLRDGHWSYYMVGWPAVSLCATPTPSPAVYLLGSNGELHTARAGGMREGNIDASNEGPERRGVMRELRAIGSHLYAVGMQRQAYRLEGSNWQRIDQSVVLPIGSRELRSFESIDGFDEDDLYAAGLEGEIHRYDGEAWSQVSSPVAAAMGKVLCAPHGVVYIGGQGGALLAGRADHWKMIDLGTKDTITDLAWFGGRLFASTLRGIISVHAERPEAVDLGLGPNWSYGRLLALDDALWSIGESRIAKTANARHWSEVVCDHHRY